MATSTKRKKKTKKSAKTTKKTVEARGPMPTEDDFSDLTNEPLYVEVRGEHFKVRALPMIDIPKLSRLMEKLSEIDTSNPTLMSPDHLRVLGQIIRIGIKADHPEMTVDKILRKLPLGAFPDFLVAVLDSNDFFGKMQDYYRMAAGEKMTLGFPNISKLPPADFDS